MRDANIEVGDIVKLTGEDWKFYDLHGETRVVIDIDLDGDAIVEDQGHILAVFADDDHDYSAELASKGGEARS